MTHKNTRLLDDAQGIIEDVARTTADPELAGFYQDMADDLSRDVAARRAYKRSEGTELDRR